MTLRPAAPPAAALDIRAPAPGDIDGILTLMAPFVEAGDLLPRTPVEVLVDLASFVIGVAPDGQVVGVGALRRYGIALAEVRSLAVRPDFRERGMGRAIVEALLAKAQAHAVAEVFALTRRPAFFYRLGFAPASMERFPDKVWGDCSRCPRRHACDEVAVHRVLVSRSGSPVNDGGAGLNRVSERRH